MGLQPGRYHVRRAVLQIDASVQRVWQEFHDIQALRAWFGLGYELEVFTLGLGGRIELSVEHSGS